jgi:UDP-glucose 4-epimerase
LASKVIQKINSQSDISYQSYDDAYAQGFEDMERRVPDNTLLRNLTGWNPTRTIDNIIDDLVAFLS